MSITFAVPMAPQPFRATRPFLYRVAGVAAATFGLLVTMSAVASAQVSTEPMPAPPSKSLELRFTSGGLVAIGSQRDAIRDAQMSGVQLAWLVRPSFAVVGTLGWARSRDRLRVDAPKLDVFASDVGVEARGANTRIVHAVTFSPFAGLGAGVRSYNYRALDIDATNNIAGYASVGGDLGVGRVGLRVEVRDYASGFKPLVGGGTSDTRNDLVIMAALKYSRRRTSQN